MFVSFQDFVGKTRNFSVSSLTRFSKEEGYTQDFGFLKKFEIGNLFIGKLFITSESRTLHCLNSGIFVDGRKRRRKIGKLRMN